MKYFAVCGGTISGIGKGVTISSIGILLKACGLNVTIIKIDPYINVDAGTMSPYEHGEVYVLNDGGEVDLDLGNYERALDICLTRDHNITTGKMYQHVIEKERRGDFLGKTVQVVPHLTNEIQTWIERVAQIPVDGDKIPDICLIEIGGTVGDIEAVQYYEAIRQMTLRLGHDNIALGLVSYVPFLRNVGELKSKPSQHACKELTGRGLIPDVIFCRCEQKVDEDILEKIGLFANLRPEKIFSCEDVPTTTEIPLLLNRQNFLQIVLGQLNLPVVDPAIAQFEAYVENNRQLQESQEIVKIAIVGKYTGITDTYLSLIKALQHSARSIDRGLQLKWIESTLLEEDNEEAWEKLRTSDGILIPGGFGGRGIEGKIRAAEYARVNDIPYLGICYGMQIAVIEFARNVVGWTNANTAEIDAENSKTVIVDMPEIDQVNLGGTMRLGLRKCNIAPDTIAAGLYENTVAYERHRHRFEVNPEYIGDFTAKGMVFSGKDETETRMEITELPSKRFYLGTQFHPEFLSRPFRESPIFKGFIRASSNYNS